MQVFVFVLAERAHVYFIDKRHRRYGCVGLHQRNHIRLLSGGLNLVHWFELRSASRRNEKSIEIMYT